MGDGKVPSRSANGPAWPEQGESRYVTLVIEVRIDKPKPHAGTRVGRTGRRPGQRPAIKPKPSIRMHNARKGIYMARDTIVRKISGPVHSTVKERWDRNAYKYREKGKPLKRLLASVGGDWSQIEVVD